MSLALAQTASAEGPEPLPRDALDAERAPLQHEAAVSRDPQRAAERNRTRARVKEAIDRQLQLQTELLESSEGRRAPSERAAPPVGLASRVAPRAPELRELPLEIFDRELTSLPPGTSRGSTRRKFVRLSLDADGDGQPELVRYLDPKTKLLLRQEEDRNYDGVTDCWSSYERGEIVARVLDSNDDGNPDVWELYAEGRMTARETDRDDDGVRDAFYRYAGDSLEEERHDSNNDAQIDLIILYENRLRVSAEEDRDTDGAMDSWTTYVVRGGRELVSRIERDEIGQGTVTIILVFDTSTGEAVIERKDEDMNGDGQVDVVSFYEGGRLVRREISDPSLVEL